MSSAEHSDTTTTGRQSAGERVQRGAAPSSPAKPVPGRLDPPGHNCQRSGTRAVSNRGAEKRRNLAHAVRRAVEAAGCSERDASSFASLFELYLRGAELARAKAEDHDEQWWADLEHVWRARRRPHVERLVRRSAELVAMREATPEPEAAARIERRASHAYGRAHSQSMPRRARLATCRTRWVAFGCACQRIERPVGCDVTLLCDWCRRRHLRKWRRRITKALRAQHDAKHAAWSKHKQRGAEPLVYLITLTIGHSGDVARDRADLWSGWRAWQKWLTAAVGGAFPYAAVWEVTEGNDGLGHVHCHIAAVLPFFSWEDANAEWRRVCPRSKNVDFKRTKAEGAAKYLAKYVTKGVQVSRMRGALAGDILASWYGKRRVSTSRAFWRALAARGPACCRRCEAQWRIVERPQRLARTNPEPAWFALVELHSVALARGPTQASLRLGLRGDVAEAPRRGLHG